jgi:hypothetical protein
MRGAVSPGERAAAVGRTRRDRGGPGGANGFAPRAELELDWLLDGPETGTRWRGYVVGMRDEVVSLSRFGPARRRERRERRERALAELVPGTRRIGRVFGTGGALAAFEDGLVTGLVPRPALSTPAGARIAADTRQRFQVVSVPANRDELGIDIHLWPVPPERLPAASRRPSAA